MIVTQRDLVIANYCISSYRKINSSKLPFTLLIYANCLKKEQKDRYFSKWGQFPFVTIYDNEQKLHFLKLEKGETIFSPEGIPRIRDDSNENYDELWTNELKKIQTEYHATADADFEILNPEFIYEMVNTLDQNPNLVAVSTDYSPTFHHVFESYSGSYVDLYERWHTWFCIYKKEALQCSTSHFYYETRDSSGYRFVYDSAALFQKNLRETFGWELRQIDPRFGKQFIHYGAFSKNRSLGRWNISLYRRLAIARKVGLMALEGRVVPARKLNAVARIAAGRLYDRFFLKCDQERSKYGS